MHWTSGQSWERTRSDLPTRLDQPVVVGISQCRVPASAITARRLVTDPFPLEFALKVTHPLLSITILANIRS